MHYEGTYQVASTCIPSCFYDEHLLFLQSMFSGQFVSLHRSCNTPVTLLSDIVSAFSVCFLGVNRLLPLAGPSVVREPLLRCSRVVRVTTHMRFEQRERER